MERLAEEDEEDGARHRLHRIQVILRTDYSPQTIILKGTESVILNDSPPSHPSPSMYILFSESRIDCFHTFF